MPTFSNDEFARAVMDDYRRGRSVTAGAVELSQKSADAARSTLIPTGHPEFSELGLGESGHCNAVAMFIDLENFTGRTFWDPPEDVVNLAHAVLRQIAEVVTSFGGHVLGLRGDGLFAAFGENRADARIDVALALCAGAKSLDAVQNALNNLLQLSGVEPVQLRVGADFGRLDFVRCGTEAASEVNVIGFAANFAAKCEKYANSWDFVAGRALLDQAASLRTWFAEHADSPKTYQRNYTRETYQFYDFSWKRILPYASSIPRQLDGRHTDAIRYR